MDREYRLDADDAAERETKLAQVIALQGAFWDALRELEELLEVELESTTDFEGMTVDDGVLDMAKMK